MMFESAVAMDFNHEKRPNKERQSRLLAQQLLTALLSRTEQTLPRVMTIEEQRVRALRVVPRDPKRMCGGQRYFLLSQGVLAGVLPQHDASCNMYIQATNDSELGDLNALVQKRNVLSGNAVLLFSE
jgi:hypothetical protein